METNNSFARFKIMKDPGDVRNTVYDKKIAVRDFARIQGWALTADEHASFTDRSVSHYHALD